MAIEREYLMYVAAYEEFGQFPVPSERYLDAFATRAGAEARCLKHWNEYIPEADKKHVVCFRLAFYHPEEAEKELGKPLKMWESPAPVNGVFDWREVPPKVIEILAHSKARPFMISLYNKTKE